MRKRIHLIVIFCLLTYSAFGQIIYTEINPSILISVDNPTPDSYEIDFNNDNTVDLLLWMDVFKVGAGCESTQMGELFSIKPVDTALIFIDNLGELAFFNHLDTLKEGNNYSLEKYYCENDDIYRCPFLLSCNYDDCSNTPTSWAGHYEAFTNKYIGLVLKIADNYHYCWIKVFKTRGVNMEIQGFAYNSTPDKEFVISDPNFTSIGTADEKIIKCYPNPTKDFLSFDIVANACTVQISDLSGRLIHNKKYNSTGFSIPTSSWIEGLYIVRITTDNGSVTKKIIKN